MGRDTLEAAVRLSGRYFPERCWPDKAVDLMDEAAAMVRFRAEKGMDRRGLRQKRQLEESLTGAVEAHAYEKAAELRDELSRVSRELSQSHRRRGGCQVEKRHLATVISHRTGIPESTILGCLDDRLKSLPENLSRRVIGQPRPSAPSAGPCAAAAWACPMRVVPGAASCSPAPPALERPSCAVPFQRSCTEAAPP